MLSRNNITVLAQLAIKAICLLENAGAIVDGLVSDEATISGERDNLKNKFNHPFDNKRCIYVFSDAPQYSIEPILERIYGIDYITKKELPKNPTLVGMIMLNKMKVKLAAQISKDNFKWLDNWKDQLNKQNISKEEFLTKSTADGLRVTIRSTIELSKYLLEECKFKYVTIANYPKIDLPLLYLD
ncbi:DDE-1 domain-containing protein [Aphis craccivora]|uniref:DDE-1 domain-containing protein n=1 Tax=Aphis craccivora TaxID=307492 RepID=A0A6G0YMA7_APHCR|nr:DDE-1 domain-containing protein [Aphis craccivora]